MRTAKITRKTAETDISLTICLDGKGQSDIQNSTCSCNGNEVLHHPGRKDSRKCYCNYIEVYL